MSKTILLLFAGVNLLVAIIAAVELFDFSLSLDRPGRLDNTKEEHKAAMLRTLHYWGFPPVVLLTGASGIVFWRVARRIKA
jgi:hypothetical protein